MKNVSNDFENIELTTQFGGYFSSYDKTKIAYNVLVGGSQNVYKKLNGNWSVRDGQKRRGEANSALSACSSSFIWNTSWGSTYTLVVADSKLYVVADDIWYILQSGLTLTRYVFDNWWNNTDKKDQLLFVNGTDDMQMWTGGFGLISSTTVNTVVLDRTITASFLNVASGTVVVNGTTYTYTGSAGSTLTGVTPDPTGEADGSGVLQSVVVSSNTPASGFNTDFIKVINNQVYCGSYTSRLIYISANDDYTDYVVPAPPVAGSPDLITLDGVAYGVGVRLGVAYVGFGSGSWASITFSDITVGSTLTRKTTVDVKPVAIGQAPYAHEFIATVGDNIIYLAQDQQVRLLGSANNSFTTTYPSLSQQIATELTQQDFTGGSLTCIGEFVYVAAPNNGRVFLYQSRTSIDPNGTVVSERLWHSPFIWNVTKVDDLNGTVVGFSNANPQIYNLWDTEQWFDDSPSSEALPYTCIVAFPYISSDSNRQLVQNLKKVYTEGYLGVGSALNILINYDYLGSTAQLSAPVNSVVRSATLYRGNSPSLGDSSIGDTPIGDTISSEADGMYPKFRSINEFSPQNCFEYQKIYFSDSANSRWELLSTGTDARLAGVNPSQIINKM